MKPQFDTDFEYDEWFEKKQNEKFLESFGELKDRSWDE